MNKAVIMIAVLSATTVATVVLEPSNIDPLHSHSWSENEGWMNWRHDAPSPGDGAVVEPTFISGFVWSENGGWINLGDGSPADGFYYANVDGTDFGVNIDPSTGELFGMAWGENAGWINFDTSVLGSGGARLEQCSHRFSGFVWGENAGWINLGDVAHYLAVGPCGDADFDCDGDVTLFDLVGFESSLGGPGVLFPCSAFDTDSDTDVDLVDFSAMQRVFTASP